LIFIAYVVTEVFRSRPTCHEIHVNASVLKACRASSCCLWTF